VIAAPNNLVSFSVMFSITQTLGSLLGTALTGTFQVWREKYHSSILVDHLTLLDPQVAARIQSGGLARSVRWRRARPTSSPTTMCSLRLPCWRC
jgi:hypothetical protein